MNIYRGLKRTRSSVEHGIAVEAANKVDGGVDCDDARVVARRRHARNDVPAV